MILMEVFNMKRTRFTCLALSAMLLLSACQSAGTPAPTDPVTEPPATEAPTSPIITPDITPVYENMYSVALPVTVENYYSENMDLTYSYSYQTIYLTLQDRDVAEKIIMDFTDRIEKKREISNEIRELADKAYQANELIIPYSYEIQYNITRIDQGVLSLFGHVVQIGDTPRANSNLISANYDMVTGDVLTVGSILFHLDTKDDLAELAATYLEKRNDLQLFDDFRSTVKARFNRDESTDEDFYFSSNGLCFYFAPAEIAPRSNGTVIVEIPYNELTGIIADAYFPAERTYTVGNIDIHKFSDADMDKYQLFPEVIADEGATKLLLTTETAVQDIRIYELVWTQDGLAYTQAKNIYASNFLSSDNAILLEAEFSNFRPSYILTYSVNGQATSYYMIADAETGEISLSSNYTPS